VLSDVLSQIEGPWNILGLQELSPAHEGDSFEFQGAFVIQNTHAEWRRCGLIISASLKDSILGWGIENPVAWARIQYLASKRYAV